MIKMTFDEYDALEAKYENLDISKRSHIYGLTKNDFLRMYESPAMFINFAIYEVEQYKKYKLSKINFENMDALDFDDVISELNNFLRENLELTENKEEAHA